MWLPMQSYIVGGIAIIAALGCSARTRDAIPRDPAPSVSAPDEPPHNRVDTTRRLQLVARAEQSLAQSLPLDYRRPFSDHESARPATASLYLEACSAGDNPSCWIAGQLGASEARALVRANCVAGDIMSCRAIPRGEATDPETPGWAGRGTLCDKDSPYAQPENKRCGIDDLRRECLAGFPFSCWQMGHGPPDMIPDREALANRVAPLSRAGCQARIGNECNNMSNEYTDAERLLVAERMCPLVVSWCAVLSKHYRNRGELVRARDLAEQHCQYGRDISACRRLGADYADRTFPEPVPGRGEALLNWGCASEVARERDPVCKARAANQHSRASKAP
jgi:hypothetical protein